MGVYDESTETKRIEAWREKLRDREQSDIAKVLSLPEGRRFVNRLLRECHPWDTSFVAGQPDVTAFQAGQQSIGVFLLKRMPIESEFAMRREMASDKLLQTQELKEDNHG